jgi:hypothetical protein
MSNKYDTSSALNTIVALLNKPVEGFLCAHPKGKEVANAIMSLLCLSLCKDAGYIPANPERGAIQCYHKTNCARLLAYCIMKKLAIFGNTPDEISGCEHFHEQEEIDEVMDVVAECFEDDTLANDAATAYGNVVSIKEKHKDEWFNHTTQRTAYIFETKKRAQKPIPFIHTEHIFPPEENAEENTTRSSHPRIIAERNERNEKRFPPLYSLPAQSRSSDPPPYQQREPETELSKKKKQFEKLQKEEEDLKRQIAEFEEFQKVSAQAEEVKARNAQLRERLRAMTTAAKPQPKKEEKSEPAKSNQDDG